LNWKNFNSSSKNSETAFAVMATEFDYSTNLMRFEVFTATTMKNNALCDVMLCRTDVSEVHIAFIIETEEKQRVSAVTSNYSTLRGDPEGMLRLLVTANVVPSSLILFISMMEAINSSETTVLIRATQSYTQKDGFLKLLYLVVL
jgi:hypothetical protein